MVRNASKHQFRAKWGVECVRCEKFQREFMARTFCTSSARYPPSFVWQPNGPGCNQMVRNACKRQFGPNGVDRVHSLRKILTQLGGTNFCTSSACFAPSFVRHQMVPNAPPMVRNTPKRQFRVQWSGLGAFIAKNSDATSWHEHLH